jgi:hypothetical protein
MSNDQANPLNEILTEKELLDLLGMKKSALNELRYKHHFPFCRVSNTNRIYLTADVVDFIKSKRIVINKHDLD